VTVSHVRCAARSGGGADVVLSPFAHRDIYDLKAKATWNRTLASFGESCTRANVLDENDRLLRMLREQGGNP